MCRRKGRTARHRIKKIKKDSSVSHLAPNTEYKELLQWMKKKFNFNCNLLTVTDFLETGRGISAAKSVKYGDTIISVPRCALIGINQAFQDSKILKSIALHHKSSAKYKISGLQALCTFLIEERRKTDFCADPALKWSSWGPYINSLPSDFTHPLYWQDATVSLLPTSLCEKIEKIREDVYNQLESINKLLMSIDGIIKQTCGDERMAGLLMKRITRSEYRWAWCCINTRCVFSDHELPFLDCLDSSSSDNYFLVPFLDLLNHSVSAKVGATFNVKTDCFEITTFNTFKKHAQVFINYGNHSSENLLVEYGFVSCKERNDNDTVAVTWKEITEFYPLDDVVEKNVLAFLKKHSLHTDCCFDYNGPSWSLTATVLVLEVFQTKKWAASKGSFHKKAIENLLKELVITVKNVLHSLASRKLTKITQRLRECDEMLNSSSSKVNKVHLGILSSFWKICFSVMNAGVEFISCIDVVEYYYLFE